MAKITSKYQVTFPKAVAEKYSLLPGDEIDFLPAGEVIRVVLPNRVAGKRGLLSKKEVLEDRLRSFDQATERIRRNKSVSLLRSHGSRGWTREDLYNRGRSG